MGWVFRLLFFFLGGIFLLGTHRLQVGLVGFTVVEGSLFLGGGGGGADGRGFGFWRRRGGKKEKDGRRR